MISRALIGGSAVVLAVAGWFALQPRPVYVNYEPLDSPEAYFPVTPGGDVKAWYARSNVVVLGEILQTAEEPTIFWRTEDEASWEIRFTYSPEYGQPLTVRVRPDGDDYVLIGKRLDVFSHDSLLDQLDTVRVRRLSEEDVYDLVGGLEDFSFFDLPGPLPTSETMNLGLIAVPTAIEGDLWGIEWRRGPEEEDYHLIIRDSRADLTPLETLASALFDRVGFRPDYAYHPIIDETEAKDEALAPAEAEPRPLEGYGE